jgi:phosphatidylglycerophosphate synthase
MKTNKLIIVPSTITGFRFLLALIFLYLFINDLKIGVIAVFLLAIITDALDGYLSRKFSVESTLGAYLDIFADFFLVLLAFIAFLIGRIYPYWILILIILVFLQFLVTSKFKILVYDPIGKYYGTFLFAIILITLISSSIYYGVLLIIIVIFTIISLSSRYLFFILQNK